jgi:hypothetical protein
MTFLDFIAFIIYTVIFYSLFLKARKKFTNPHLKKYHRNLFWIKVFSSFVYALFVLYISPGDSTRLYFPEGYNFFKLILHDSSNINLLFSSSKDFNESLLTNTAALGYLKSEGNYFVTCVTAVMCFLTFGKYMAVTLTFAMLSITGVWKLYLFFYNQYPQLHKQIAIAVLYLPTFIFWSSGILKDTLCITALGWLTYSLYNIFYSKEFVAKNLIIAFASMLVLYLAKIYILISYLPILCLYLILKNVTFIKNAFYKTLLILGVLGGSVFGFIALGDSFDNALGNYAVDDISNSISSYQGNYSTQSNRNGNEGSYFSLGVEFDGSVSSLAKMAPAAIIATFYRPFIWESRKISTLLSSFEGLTLMLFTIFVLIKVGIKKFILTVFREPIVLYSFLFALIFGLFVGATTLNFGSLVRYKIPAMPFYVISLFFILYFNGKLKIKINPQ